MDPSLDGGDFESAALLGKAIGALTRRRIKILELAEETRVRAVEVVAGCEFKYLDEGRLWNEWRNDLLAVKAGSDRFSTARKDPDADYLDWVAGRVVEPYRVSCRAKERVVSDLGFEAANLLLMVRWPQEVAWAQRMRSSTDDKVAVISSLFLSKAQRDASDEFLKVADAWREVTGDWTYVASVAHEYDPEAIAAGYGEGFEPIFLRRGRIVFSERIETMDAPTLRAMAERSRKAHGLEASAKASRRAIDSIYKTSLARMAGVIQVAIEQGLDADGLVDAQDRFVESLGRNEVALSRNVGLPYQEFIAWLRTERHARFDVRMPFDDLASESDLLAMASSGKRWLSNLPSDYLAMGAMDPLTFNEWSLPIKRGARRAPRDLVVDYGFFLAARSMRTAP